MPCGWASAGAAGASPPPLWYSGAFIAAEAPAMTMAKAKAEYRILSRVVCCVGFEIGVRKGQETAASGRNTSREVRE